MINTRNVIYLLVISTGFLLAFCSGDPPPSGPEETYLNMDDSVAYVGMETCRSCHAGIHATFIHTGMGRSFDLASREKSDAQFGAHALVYDQNSNFYYRPYFEGDTLFIREYRLENGDTIHQRTEKVSYIVGSGQHTNSHIIDINGYIFQAPVTWYTQQQKWDMAPGFKEENERFDRFLTTECITCHNHFPEHVAGSLNKYSSMPRGIECERCHGPGEIHVREKLAGRYVDTSSQIDYSIVNPRDLPRDLQMDLCQRCHLQGIAVLEEGKTFFDFKPGMRLQEVLNVFLPRFTNSHEKFIMASQADRLRMSNCYKGSDMTCMTCHNPHQSVEVTSRQTYNAACISCHGGDAQTACLLPAADRTAEQNGCSGCHMPASGSIDIPHVNITDHYISRENVRDQPLPGLAGPAAFLGLEILTKENPSPLDMARGYIAMFDKYMPAALMLDSAGYYLRRSGPVTEATFKTWIHYHFAGQEYGEILDKAAGREAVSIEDGWTAYRIGEACYRSGNFQEAAGFYERATQLMPFNLEFREKLGAAQLQLNRLEEARETFEFVLAENPKRKLALSNLGYLLVLNRNIPAGEALYDRAIALDPDYEQALLNKAAVRLLYNDRESAKALVNRVLKIDPQNQQALQALARIGG